MHGDNVTDRHGLVHHGPESNIMSGLRVLMEAFSNGLEALKRSSSIWQ